MSWDEELYIKNAIKCCIEDAKANAMESAEQNLKAFVKIMNKHGCLIKEVDHEKIKTLLLNKDFSEFESGCYRLALKKVWPSNAYDNGSIVGIHCSYNIDKEEAKHFVEIMKIGGYDAFLVEDGFHLQQKLSPSVLNSDKCMQFKAGMLNELRHILYCEWYIFSK